MNELPSRPRVLLRHLHRVMAGPGSAEERLQKVVRLIAQNMVAEVCSVYLVRAGDILELFATEGLNPEAVHRTRLRIGEGLVGLVAETGMPLRLQDAPRHPHFVFRPETGEEPYHGFIGVPILHAGRVVGVLVVQNVAPRRYSDEEEETLQTIAMVLAELIASGQLVAREEMLPAPGTAEAAVTLDGEPLAAGIGMGAAVVHEGAIRVERYVAEDIEAEHRRLEEALAALRAEVDRLVHNPEIGMGAEQRDILEAYKMFAYDRGWQERLRAAIDAGLTAEAAVERVTLDHRARLEASQDPYLRARFHDLEDLSRRLMRLLTGRSMRRKLEGDTILIARNMGPAELLEYDLAHVKGIVLEEGAATAHVAILARSLAIPMIGQVTGARELIGEGDQVVVDALAGHVFVRPQEDVRELYVQAVAAREQEQEAYYQERALESRTRDGVAIDLLINAGLASDVAALARTGAQGIGLFRTEFQFMLRATLPRLDAQRELYAMVLEESGDKPVHFRTLDLGGDKIVPFLPHEREPNPAMGWRAIRLALDRPALLRYQLRALMQAAAGRELRVMFPMVATAAEFGAARRVLEREKRRFQRLGLPLPDRILVGAMIEVPSLFFELEDILGALDFLSVGTNDLTQFLFAADRTNPRIARRYDPLSPAMLRFLRGVLTKAQEADVPVTVCGELAGRPLDALALIGLGVRRLSMSPSAVGPMRRLIRSLELARFENFMRQALTTGEQSLRAELRHFARDHGTPLPEGLDFG